MTVGRGDFLFLAAAVSVTAVVIVGLYLAGVTRFSLW
jgi:hypothetical protein